MRTDEQLSRSFGGPWERIRQAAAGRTDADRGPLVRTSLPGHAPVWLVTGHRECATVLSDPVFRRRPPTHTAGAFPASPGLEVLSGIDPPRHTRLRTLAARPFAARRVERLRPELERRVARRLAAVDLESGTTVDLYRRFCLPLSVETTFAVTGLPPRFHTAAADWAHRVFAQTDLSSPEFARLVDERARFVEAVIADKRRSPGRDVLTDLIGHRDRDGSITEEELRALVGSLPVGGHVEGAMQLAAMLLILLNRPDDLDRLRREPRLIPTAVRELLRYAPVPFYLLPRFPVRDIEFGGTRIKAGETMIPLAFAANHDPAVFDEPHRLDLGRAGEHPLTFGHGTHYCPGAHLMRLMMTVALEQVLEPLAARGIGAPVDGATWLTGGLVHGVVGLPVTAPRTWHRAPVSHTVHI